MHVLVGILLLYPSRMGTAVGYRLAHAWHCIVRYVRSVRYSASVARLMYTRTRVLPATSVAAMQLLSGCTAVAVQPLSCYAWLHRYDVAMYP